MNTRTRFGVSISALALLAAAGPAQAAQGPRARRPGAILYAPKEVTASGATRTALDHVLAVYGIRSERKLAGGRVHQARAALPQGLTEEQLAQELLATGAVSFAEPDYLMEPHLIPNDTSYAKQWQHAKINSPAAWDVTTGSSSILAAVCDTGVQADHPDLAPNLVLPGYNTVDNSTNSSPIASHGTMVAGCVSAVGNNSQGVAGVSWKVKILPVRITNDTSGNAYISDMAECVRYAADRGAKVVNLSYSGASSSTIDSAAKYLRGKGGLLFMSAGNSNADVSSWPDYASFVLVGATDSSDARSSFSNYGTPVDIVAPGTSVYTTYPGSSYTYVSGTSFASPITAGAAALLWSVNPAFTPDQVEGYLFSTADDLGAAGEDSVFGHGRLNVGNAVRTAANYTPPPFTPVRVNAGGGATNASVGTFAADSGYSAGTALAYTGVTVANTADPALYYDVRYASSFSYSVSVPNGTYRVRLHFAEMNYSSSGQRSFNVSLNGTRVLSSFDIYAAAGGAKRAIVKEFTASVTAETLKISLASTITGRNAVISAFEILPP